jgi:hypothetical protein
MLDFSSIGVFILATTTINTRNAPQTYPTYYESRILPIMETWGSFFPHLYFVFGTNKFDYQFLKKKCTSKPLEQSEIHSEPNDFLEIENKQNVQRRKLVPHTHQTPPKNKAYLLHCNKQPGEGKYTKVKNITDDGSASAQSSSPASSIINSYYHYVENRQFPWKALYFANCTGEYFGQGPTCRCQETFRYYLNHKNGLFSSLKWIIFMDDDIYLRPYAFLSFLSNIMKNHNEEKPWALISSETGHEIRATKQQKYNNYTRACNNLFRNSFHLAQPAIMNRKGIEVMQKAIEADAFVSLQTMWGGSHDVILGLVLWLHNIPILSFSE